MSTTLAPEASTVLSHPNSLIPTAPTFSFKAPLSTASSSLALPTSASTPASPLKHRRVSLALPNSPRLVPAWSFRDDTGIESHVAETSALGPERKVKIRKIASGGDTDGEQTHAPLPEKKPRKKWTPEETQMLVDGCNRHGVGNWKAILSDPTLKFDNRSPVDLKDRFRTYFPDAYKQHYPNARTHLSSKIRSTLPDGTSLFEKTRSKKRRPFTEEEDRALKAGYEKHGTVWAQIVKDPIFQEQNRRSTDLRDRFRNAFPELYQAAGYKPRNASRKRLGEGVSRVPIRAATDDQLSMSTTGPVRSRKRAHTSSGLFRGGTKSVPQSTACSEDDDSSGAEEDNDSAFKLPPTPVFVDTTASSTRAKKQPPPPPAVTAVNDTAILDDDDMELVTLDSDPIASDLMRTNSQGSELDSRSQAWSSGLDTPTHSSQAAWSTAAGSPTSSHLSADFTMNSAHSSPFQRRLDNPNMGNMIGKSAWTQDWFSPNPRLDPGSSGATSSYIDGGMSPASPFSFHALNYGVMDRYDLFPTSNPHDFMSEVGVGDSHSTFSDDVFPSSGFRGFTHHSSYAGDLIFGARTHQPQQSFYPGLGFGTDGLGLTGMAQQSLHPLGIHTPVLPGIDEIGLTGISLDDQPDDVMEDAVNMGLVQQKDEPQEPPSVSDRFNLDDLVNIPQESHITPPGTPQTRPRASSRAPSGSGFQGNFSQHGRSISVPPSEARSGYPQRVPLQTPQSDLLSKSLVFFGQSVVDSPMVDGNGNAVAAIDGNGSVEPRRIQEPLSSTSASTGSSIYSPNLLLSSSAGQHSQTTHSALHDGWRFSSADPSELVNVLDLHYYNHFTTNGNMGSSVNTGVAMPSAGLDLAQPLVVNPKSLSSGGMTTTSTGTIRRHSQHYSSRPVVTLNLGGGSAKGAVASTSSSSSLSGGNGSVPVSATSSKTIPSSVAAATGVLPSSIGVTTKSIPPPPPPPPPPMRHQSGSGGHHHHHQRGQSAVCPQDLILRSGDNKRKRASWDGRHP